MAGSDHSGVRSQIPGGHSAEAATRGTATSAADVTPSTEIQSGDQIQEGTRYVSGGHAQPSFLARGVCV